jgi:hypothetical protein
VTQIRQAIADQVPEPVRPSSSTVATTLAGAIVTVLVYVVDQFTPAPLPAPVVAALTTIVGVAAGYFFSGGRSRDTV